MKDRVVDIKADWLLAELPDKGSCIVTEELLLVLVDVIVRAFEDKEALDGGSGGLFNHGCSAESRCRHW